MIKRFPLSVGYILIIAGLFFYMVEYLEPQRSITNYMQVIFALINTLFLSIGVYLLAEKQQRSTLTIYLGQGWIIFLGSVFYSYFVDNLEIYSTVITGGTVISILAIPFLSKFFKKTNQQVDDHTIRDSKSQQYYTYFISILQNLISAIIVWTAIFLLGLAAFYSICYLFGIVDRDFTFPLHWAVVAFSLVTPLFFLAKLPSNIWKLPHKNYPFLDLLLRYIAIPAIYIFFIILYAYTTKVLLNFWHLPKGQISWIVIAFASFGYGVYMLTSTHEKNNQYIKIFRHYFPFVLIPQICMLFYAIYLRINQHNITINRYLVLAFGVWLLIISLYFISSKQKKIILIPLTFTISCLIISIWPWSIINLTESRQLARLENNLRKANIVHADGSIHPLQNYQDIDEQLSKDIANGIDYLCNLSNCKTIKHLFANELASEMKKTKNEILQKIKKKKSILDHLPGTEKAEIKKEKKDLRKLMRDLKQGMNTREIKSFIREKIKVTENNWEYGKSGYDNIYFDRWKDFFPIDITWYEKIYFISDTNILIDNNILDQTIFFLWIGEKTPKKVIANRNIKEKIIEQQDQESIILDFSYEERAYRYIVNHASISNTTAYKLWDSIDGYLLLKE